MLAVASVRILLAKSRPKMKHIPVSLCILNRLFMEVV